MTLQNVQRSHFRVNDCMTRLSNWFSLCLDSIEPFFDLIQLWVHTRKGYLVQMELRMEKSDPIHIPIPRAIGKLRGREWLWPSPFMFTCTVSIGLIPGVPVQVPQSPEYYTLQWAYPETHFGLNGSSLSLIYSFSNDLRETGNDWKRLIDNVFYKSKLCAVIMPTLEQWPYTPLNPYQGAKSVYSRRN